MSNTTSYKQKNWCSQKWASDHQWTKSGSTFHRSESMMEGWFPHSFCFMTTGILVTLWNINTVDKEVLSSSVSSFIFASVCSVAGVSFLARLVIVLTCAYLPQCGNSPFYLLSGSLFVVNIVLLSYMPGPSGFLACLAVQLFSGLLIIVFVPCYKLLH